MARRVRDATLESRTARGALKPRGKPYYKAIGNGLHLGYRKGKNGGRWVVRLYLGNAGYRVETIADADDRLDPNGDTILDFFGAQERARELQAALSSGGQTVKPTYTVREAIQDYVDWMDANRKSGQDARYRAEAHILPEFGNIDVAKLTARQIRQWHVALAEAPRRQRTPKGQAQRFHALSSDPDAVRRRRANANRVLTTLKAALNRAWREGHVENDHAWRRVKPFGSVDTARVRYLSVAEARRLLNASEPAFRCLVQAALQTGARYGELAELRVEDFNSDVGTIAVRMSKSGKPRYVVLTEEGVEFFRRLAAGRTSHERLLSKENGQPWQKSHQLRPMAEACRNGRIEPPVGFHILRHTWASLSVMNGVPLMVVARNLGHADTRMVEKHYGHLAPSYVADAIRAGAPRFAAAEPGNVAAFDDRREQL